MVRPYVVFLLLVSTELRAECTEPGIARWAIKSSVASITALQHPRKIDLQYLRDLSDPPDVTNNDARYREHRIPAFDNPANLQEGDIVSVEAWLYLVATEGNDCEYHIQISDSASSGNHCVIVEVPRAHQVSVPVATLRSRVKTVRDFVKTRLLNGQEPGESGNLMGGSHWKPGYVPPYVRVTGQLFFDSWHLGSPPRGKKGMKCETLWEIHPITAMVFAPKPN